jgi:hypothetical protein
MPGAEEVGERDIVGLVVVHTRLHVGPAAYQSLKYTKIQCCGSGSGIGAFLTPGSGIQIRDLGSEKGKKQRCGSGSGIRCPFDPRVRDPESGMG